MPTGNACSREGERLGDAPIDVLFQHLHQFGAALVPLASVHFLAAVQRERVGKIRVRIRFRLVVVGVVGCLLVSTRTGTQGLDA